MAAFKITGFGTDGRPIDAVRVSGIRRGPGEALSWVLRRYGGRFPGDTVFVVEPLSRRYKRRKVKETRPPTNESKLYLDGIEIEPLSLTPQMIKEGRKKLVEVFRKEGLEIPRMEGP